MKIDNKNNESLGVIDIIDFFMDNQWTEMDNMDKKNTFLRSIIVHFCPLVVHKKVYIIIGLALLLVSKAETLTIPAETAKEIGAKIWNNECASTVLGLTTWNLGEDFASIGIGHFIWYHKDKIGPYEEQFPQLLTYLENHGVILPKWLQQSKTCPWDCRETFYQDIQHEKLNELRTLLTLTIDLQVLFMAKRLEEALPKITSTLPQNQAAIIRKKFYCVAKEPFGLYALLDYINFKGEGTSKRERYNEKGWGLLQVLQEMPEPIKDNVMGEFISAAKRILTQRVANAPRERGEERWIKGWFNRLDTYLYRT